MREWIVSMDRARATAILVGCECSLAVYCVSVLLSFAAHMMLSMGWNNLASQTLISVAGIAIMAAIATQLAKLNVDRYQRPL
jgi:divalent metal cation (Fe/Co/Zn/Cd) transporter